MKLNNMTNLQSLTAKIKKVIPEIDELKFGCKLNVMKSRLFIGDAFIKEVWTIVGFESKYPQLKLFIAKREYCSHETEMLSCINKIGEEIDWQFRDVEILGRDITLEDVLIYLQEENDWLINGFISVSSNGNFYIDSPDDRMITSFKWEFNKPLSLQSPDTIKYLDEIIK